MEIKIPNTIPVAGFKVKILTAPSVGKELQEYKLFGRWLQDQAGIRIELDISAGASEISNTFIHECLEGINSLYLGHSLKESEINAVANGLHQIFEGIGVRFVKKLDAMND